MKCFISALAAIMAATLLANTSPLAGHPRPDPAKMAEMEKRQGGRIMPPDSGNRVLIWDSTGKATVAVTQFTNLCMRLWHLPCVVKTDKTEGTCLYKSAKSVKSAKFPCVIFLGDADAGMPALSIFPEENIGCINVAALSTPDASVFEKRIIKELSRAFGFAFGGYSITRTACAMDLIFSLDELDEMTTVMLSPIRFSGVTRTASRLNVPLFRPTTYQMAVRQGWAPAPTNDLQKAIWEKYKDLPKIVPGGMIPPPPAKK